jgi:hypothetical protein
MQPLLQALIALISGGALWEGFKFIYPEIKQPIASRIEAKKALYANIDPLLKSASELYGKILSLAKEDFSTFINPSNSISFDPQHNKKYILYLFSQFWGQLEYLRLQSQYVSFSKIKKGKQLLKFIDTIESRKYRILDRSIQRVIGECLILNKDQKFRVMTLQEFLVQIDSPVTPLNKWMTLLEQRLMTVNNKENRQSVLRFGIVIAALIDHFDPNYNVIRERPIYVNKLSGKSKMAIKNNLCKYYLPFLTEKTKYYQ